MSDTDSFTLEAWYYCPSDVSVSDSPNNFRREIINLSPVTSISVTLDMAPSRPDKNLYSVLPPQ